MCYFRGMKFFIDTANLDQIREAEALGVLDGVTTNPSLMAKEGITGDEAVKAHYKAICEIVDGDVSAEVISTEFEGMIAEGQALAALHPNIAAGRVRQAVSPAPLHQRRSRPTLFCCSRRRPRRRCRLP